jgi:glycine betaine/proline transport system permease protein
MWPFNLYTIPLDDWIQSGVNWLSQNFRSFFQIVKKPFDFTLSGTEDFLLWLPPVVVLGLIFLIAWQIKGWKFAAISTLTMLFVGFLGLWAPTMTTLSLVLSAVIFCALVGMPLGILAARSDKFAGILRPILDAMQTIPAFVYLVPVVMLFGVGLVPGLIAVIVFALPPIIRLTDLGIRQVPQDVVEAGRSFGGTSNQILFNIQIPLAMPTIMAGLNQTLMLAMSMAVVIALIGASGLGLVVWTGLGRNDVGYAAIGGIGIVAIAIILDRLSQSFSKSPTEKKQPGLLGRSINWLRSRLNKNRRN